MAVVAATEAAGGKVQDEVVGEESEGKPETQEEE